MVVRAKSFLRRAALAAGGAALGLIPVLYYNAGAGEPGPAIAAAPLAAPAAAPGQPVGPAPAAPAASSLPLKDVFVFSSGVTYYERSGKVTGNSTVDMKFKVGDINDLLKSLVVQDLGGGTVSTVTYGSRDPLTKTLRSFAIDLTSNPTMGQLLSQVRGEKVEISAPNVFVGTIIGIERQKQAVKDGVIDVDVMNILTADGLRSVPLNQIQRIKFLSESLNNEFQQALATLASSHDTQKKTVDLVFNGQGERPVRVGYVTESPIWKTSYRLLVPDDGKMFVQGWAIVENTTDEDWSGINLTLVSGRPISFIQDLYQPLYVPRPVVQPELFASLRPPTYEGGLPSAPPGIGGAAAGPARDEDRNLARSNEKADYGSESKKAREQFRAFDKLAETAVAQATGGQVGELFQYSVKVPVTLPRQKSAMIPIINGAIEGKRISIYNSNVQAKHPLSGLRLKNTTGLHLMQGPITVYADSVYGGDARIEDLKPGEERLISYGIDLGTVVDVQDKTGKQELISAAARKGTLVLSRRYESVKEYTIKNGNDKARTVLIEHPLRGDWKVLEPAKIEERTGTHHRIPVEVAAGKTVKLTVREEHRAGETVYLSNQSVENINYYISSTTILSPAIKQALGKLVTMKEGYSRLQRDRGAVERRINEITLEQDRIRRNMAGLPQNSDLFNRFVKKLDEQETEIEKLRKDLEAKRGEEESARRALDAYLLDLNLD